MDSRRWCVQTELAKMLENGWIIIDTVSAPDRAEKELQMAIVAKILSYLKIGNVAPYGKS
jgi:hypothetical protein